MVLKDFVVFANHQFKHYERAGYEGVLRVGVNYEE